MPALPKTLTKFYADRGPHLAAMIAYFALLSFVPLLFLTVSLLALAGRPDESSYLVTELKRAFPGSSITSIVSTVREIQKHATALGIVLMLLSLVTLFVGLLIGSFGFDLLTRYAGAGGVASNTYFAYGLSVAVSLLAVFIFLMAVYYLLTNVEHSFVDVLPGAVVGAILLEASFQVLPLYVRFSNNVVALIVFGAEVNCRYVGRDGAERDAEEVAGLA